MTITLNLDPQTEAYLQEQAQREGTPLNEYAALLLKRDMPAPPPALLTGEAREKVLDELADAIGPDVPHWTDEDISREVIYGDDH